MGDVEQFPQNPITEMTSHMSMLSCGDCHVEWVALYTTTIDRLHCPYCESANLINRQGEREVFFYEHDEYQNPMSRPR